MKGIITHNYVLLHKDPSTNPVPEHIIKLTDLSVFFDGDVVTLNHQLLLKIMLHNAKKNKPLSNPKNMIINCISKGFDIIIKEPTYRDQFGETRFESFIVYKDRINQNEDIFILSISGLRRYKMKGISGTEANPYTEIYIDVTTNSHDILYNCVPDLTDSYAGMKYVEAHADVVYDTTSAMPKPTFRLREYEIPEPNKSVGNNGNSMIIHGLISTLDARGAEKKKPVTSSAGGVNLAAVTSVARYVVDESMKEALTFATIKRQHGGTDAENQANEEANLQSYINYVGNKNARMEVNIDELSLWTLEDAQQGVKLHGIDAANSLTNKYGEGAYIDDDGRLIVGASRFDKDGKFKGEVKSSSSKELRRADIMPSIEVESNSKSDVLPSHSSYMASPKYSYNIAKLMKVMDRVGRLIAFGGIATLKVSNVIDMVNIVTSGSYKKIVGKDRPKE